MELDIEPNLLETDIAQKSYNYAKNPTANFDPNKLVFRDEENSQWKFSVRLDNLDEFQQRTECLVCSRKCMYYCAECKKPLECTKDVIPQVILPVKIDIVKDRRESNSKSTAVHAKIISPNEITLYDDNETLPEYDAEKTVLVFPSKEAIPLQELPNHKRISRIVFIDATWKQAHQLSKSPALKQLVRVRLENYTTLYWRYQTGEPDKSLATIEVIGGIFIWFLDAFKDSYNF